MTPNNKDLVDALREAREALSFYDMANKPAHLFDVGILAITGWCRNWYQVDGGSKAHQVLKKINPILNELEE